MLRSGDKVAFAKMGGEYIFRYASDESTKSHKKTFFDDYILGTQLGLGHYAVVKEARDRCTGDIVAVKIFHPNKASQGLQTDEDKKLQQEMSLLLSIDHPNIVRFILHYVEPINEHASTTYLVLEKMNSGELFQRIVNKTKLRQDETRALFTQLLAGLGYLHKKNIIHRDIKPENILLDITPRSLLRRDQTGPWDDDEYDVTVKIADFGLAKFIGELKFTNTLCGTPAYVAPEILSNNTHYLTKADMWLTGVLLYVCLCGFPPFSDELAPPNMKEQILQAKYAFYSPYWDDIHDSALDLISNLLVRNPRDRFDVEQTLAHPWFDGSAMDITSVPGLEASSSTIQSSFMSQSSQRMHSNVQPVTLRERFTSDLNGSSIETERT